VTHEWGQRQHFWGHADDQVVEKYGLNAIEEWGYSAQTMSVGGTTSEGAGCKYEWLCLSSEFAVNISERLWLQNAWKPLLCSLMHRMRLTQISERINVTKAVVGSRKTWRQVDTNRSHYGVPPSLQIVRLPKWKFKWELCCFYYGSFSKLLSSLTAHCLLVLLLSFT